MAEKNKAAGFEPEVWFLVFREKSESRLARWLSFGRFKHVFAIGWVSSQQVWLIYEVSWDGATVAVLPDNESTAFELQALQADSVTLAIVPRLKKRRWFRIGFWCVPAMAHLVGMPCALRPDTLFRHCRRHNAEVVTYGSFQTIEEAGSDSAGRG